MATRSGIRAQCGLEKVELVPVGRENTDELPANRIYELKLGRLPSCRLEFIECYIPSVALHLPEVFAWAGSRLYRQRLEKDSTLQMIDFDNELLAIYPLGTSWC